MSGKYSVSTLWLSANAPLGVTELMSGTPYLDNVRLLSQKSVLLEHLDSFEKFPEADVANPVLCD